MEQFVSLLHHQNDAHLQYYSLLFVCVQVDNKGRNFLHVAVQNSDIESVLFLISVQANVNSRVQDAAKLTPLHLAVQAGSEIIVRNLVHLTFSCFLSASAIYADLSVELKERRC